MSGSPDVIVVGAGMVGTLTALGLAEAGLAVTLIDAEFPGGGSTGAAMGHVVAMDDSPAQLALCHHSRQRWSQLAMTFPASAEFDRCGTLWVAATEDELEGARMRARAYAAMGIAADVIESRDLARLEPELRPGLAGGLRVAEDAVCYPPAVARVVTERAARASAIIRLYTRVVALTDDGVQLTDGTRLSGGHVVIAAGVSSPDLVPGLPIVPRKGHLVITERAPNLVRHQLVELGYLHSAHTFGAASVAFNVQPRRTGQALIGSSRELVGFDRSINHQLLGAMLARASEFVPKLARVRALRTWFGFRPATADKLPLIGRWPAHRNLWIAGGHEGLGITMATGTADIIVAGILNVPPPVEAAPFRPDRPMPEMAAAA